MELERFYKLAKKKSRAMLEEQFVVTLWILCGGTLAVLAAEQHPTRVTT